MSISAVRSDFGVALRRLRRAAGLSQEELSQRLGVGGRNISRWERGLAEPLWSVVVRLADALGVSTEEFRRLASEGEGCNGDRHIRRGRPRGKSRTRRAEK